MSASYLTGSTKQFWHQKKPTVKNAATIPPLGDSYFFKFKGRSCGWALESDQGVKQIGRNGQDPIEAISTAWS
jgi:hypothetical protein